MSIKICLQTLNDLDKDCLEPDNYCIAALQQKPEPHLMSDNLRHVPAKELPFGFRLENMANQPCKFNLI